MVPKWSKCTLKSLNGCEWFDISHLKFKVFTVLRPGRVGLVSAETVRLGDRAAAYVFVEIIAVPGSGDVEVGTEGEVIKVYFDLK